MSGQQNVPAGWYNMEGDPPNSQRWWDGVQWTSNTQFIPTAAPVAQPVAAVTQDAFAQPAAQVAPGAAVAAAQSAEPAADYGSMLTNDLASYWDTMDEPIDAAAQFSAEYARETAQPVQAEGEAVDLTPSFDAPEGSSGESPFDWMLLPYKRYAQFNGRSCRAEYWWYTLFQFGVAAVLVIGILALGEGGGIVSQVLALGFTVFWLGSLIPGWAVTVRRLHDTGRSGWTQLLGLIPFIGGFIVLAYLLTPGTSGWNKYGETHIRP